LHHSNLHRLKRTDPDCIKFEAIKKVNDTVTVYHSQYTAHNWLVSDRDFVLLRDEKETEDSFIQFGCSIDEKEFSDDSLLQQHKTKHVRGSIYMYAKIVKKINDGVSLDAYSHTNPNGWVPTDIVNFFSASQSFSALRLKAELVK
jgi:roadblock/LC7 domain-containing protein